MSGIALNSGHALLRGWVTPGYPVVYTAVHRNPDGVPQSWAAPSLHIGAGPQSSIAAATYAGADVALSDLVEGSAIYANARATWTLTAAATTSWAADPSVWITDAGWLVAGGSISTQSVYRGAEVQCLLDGRVYVTVNVDGSASVTAAAIAAALGYTPADAALVATDAELAAGLADKIDTSDSTAAGRALLTGADAAAQRTALGLGTAATKAAGSAFGVAMLDGKGAVLPAMTGNNAAVGTGALANVTGSWNTAVGNNALTATTTGSMNVGIGNDALKANLTGTRNIGIGNSAGGATTSGGNNIAIGVNALASGTTGSMNVAIGYAALKANTTNGSVAIGEESLTAATGAVPNTAVGYFALRALTTGAGNVAMGEKAMEKLTTGDTNTAVGQLCMSNLTTGIQNVAVGHGALYGLTVGLYNTAVGMEAGHRDFAGTAADVIFGDYNTHLGYRCSVALGTDPSYTTGLGSGASMGADYATALGVKTSATGAGSVALGTDSTGTGASTATADELALGTTLHRVRVAGSLNIAQRTPTGSADALGAVGDITTDDNYIYAKTATGWKRAALSTW